MTEPKHVFLNPKDLSITNRNPRSIDKQEPEFLQLIDSVKAHGVIVPVIAHKVGDRLELIAGERRTRAAVAAKLEVIPVVLHPELTPQEAIDILALENSCREDLTVLEEAMLFRQLKKAYGNDLEAIASKYGCTKGHVEASIRVVDGLAECWKEKLSDGELGKWTLAHWAEIARLPMELQVMLDESDWFYEDDTVKQIRDQVSRYTRAMKSAPWPLDVPMQVLINEKPRCIACEGCPDRSGAQAVLFDLAALEDDKKRPMDVCLNPGCWQAHMEAHLKSVLAGLKESQTPFILIHDGYNTRTQGDLGRVYGKGDYEKCKKSDKDSVVGVYAASDNPARLGNRQYVRLTSAKPNQMGNRDVSDQVTVTAEGKVVKTLAARREELEKKRLSWTVKVIRDRLAEADCDCFDAGSPGKAHCLAALVAVFGAAHSESAGICLQGQALWDQFWCECYPEESRKSLDYLWAMVRARLVDLLSYSGPITQIPETYVENARNVCRLMVWSFEDLHKESIAEMPEPKSWEKLNEDGTPK